MAASENGRFEHQFRILLVVVVLDLVVSLLLWGILGGRQALGFFAVTTALLFLYTLFFCERMLEEGFRSESRIVARDMRYRQTLGLLPEGVVILGNNAEIEWMNVAAERHFGMDASVLGKPFHEAVSDERLRNFLNARRFDEPMLCQFPGRDEIFEISVVAPDLQHTLIVSHDVTAKRRVEDMRRDFVANVSHELRTPLTVIGGFFDLDAALEPHHVALIRDQVQRMRHIVDDLLMLSGLENRDETQTDESEVVAMHRIAEDVVREGEALSLGRHTFVKRRHNHGALGAKRHGCGLFRRRHGDRDRGQAHSETHGTLLPRRQGTLPSDGRHGAGPCDREARPAPQRRDAQDRVDARRRIRLLHAFS